MDCVEVMENGMLVFQMFVQTNPTTTGILALIIVMTSIVYFLSRNRKRINGVSK